MLSLRNFSSALCCIVATGFASVGVTKNNEDPALRMVVVVPTAKDGLS